jgi:hypothetical protein
MREEQRQKVLENKVFRKIHENETDHVMGKQIKLQHKDCSLKVIMVVNCGC